eukprot:GHRQ01012780.1.p1 GENE.GHRQ01012780.1~~GHRQ01012780.1.p1  ORF type:complete len:154 (-),score=6.83 GHRQ01012780.1:349-810(-)
MMCLRWLLSHGELCPQMLSRVSAVGWCCGHACWQKCAYHLSAFIIHEIEIGQGVPSVQRLYCYVACAQELLQLLRQRLHCRPTAHHQHLRRRVQQIKYGQGFGGYVAETLNVPQQPAVGQAQDGAFHLYVVDQEGMRQVPLQVCLPSLLCYYT